MTTQLQSHIYLIQDGADIGTSIYKLGRTSRRSKDSRVLCRLNDYSEGTVQHATYSVPCAHLHEVEQMLIDEFNKKFRLARGREWFEGDMYEMRKCMSILIDGFVDRLPHGEKHCIVTTFNSHVCTLCNYTTDRISNYKRHMLSHKRKEERLLSQTRKCHWCPQEFTNVYNCSRHMKLYCKSKPNIEPNLNTPAPTQQLNTGAITTNPYQCNTCYKSYCRKNMLDKHKLKCQGVKSSLECPKCHVTLSCWASKSRHLRTCTAQPIPILPNTSNYTNQSNTFTNTLHQVCLWQLEVP